MSGSGVGGGDGGGGGGGSPTGTVTITMPTSIDEVDLRTDLGAAFQGMGGHTMYGAAVYFDDGAFLWTSVNGVGAQPQVAGTAYEVALTGTAPFSGAAWAAAAESVISAAGRTVSRSGATIFVTVASPARATAAAAAQAALTTHAQRGGGRIVGSRQMDAGGSANAGSQGWMQVLPADVPSVPFRVIAIGVRRGSNVSAGVRISLGSGGGGDGNPVGLVVDEDRTMGNSGAHNWHYESISPVYYAAGTRLWLGVHGNGSSSSIYMGAAINTGSYEVGSTNMWTTTPATSGATNPTVSPTSIANSYNYGLAIRLVIQLYPYQADGGYRVIGGAIEGEHDGSLYESGVPSIFVGWRLVTPPVDDLTMFPPRIRLGAHAAGASNRIRIELWNPLGGPDALAGDTLVGHLGTTADDQGTGWSTVEGMTPFAISAATEYRYTVKGQPAVGEDDDTTLSVWLGSNGAGAQAVVGYPAYGPGGVAVNLTEREVLASNPDGADETAINLNPTVPTASPNPSNGDVEEPENLSMLSIVMGKHAPVVSAA